MLRPFLKVFRKEHILQRLVRDSFPDFDVHRSDNSWPDSKDQRVARVIEGRLGGVPLRNVTGTIGTANHEAPMVNQA